MSIYRSNKRLRLLLVGVLVITVVGCLALTAFAAETEQGPSTFKKIWMLSWRVLNFLILAYFLFRLLRKPISSFFQESARVIREQLQGTEQSCQQAEQELQEVENRLEALSQEIEKLQDVIGEHGERERDKIIANARQTAEQMLENAKLEAAYSAQQAKNQLRFEVIDSAVKMAAESIQKAIESGDQERLVKEYLQDLREMPSSSV
ncbi:MAG: ATP synthase F0 subunit B [Deltaproteobacteria bacterium]|jgi:F-type H+-transporting ATPase subunit b|nr:ATP synthase F0 subunit B [Deltaproteobacteria bacterium]